MKKILIGILGGVVIFGSGMFIGRFNSVKKETFRSLDAEYKKTVREVNDLKTEIKKLKEETKKDDKNKDDEEKESKESKSIENKVTVSSKNNSEENKTSTSYKTNNTENKQEIYNQNETSNINNSSTNNVLIPEQTPTDTNNKAETNAYDDVEKNGNSGGPQNDIYVKID